MKFVIASLTALLSLSVLAAPAPQLEPKQGYLSTPQGNVQDDYLWLEMPQHQHTLNKIVAQENRATQAYLADQTALKNQLRQEMLARLNQQSAVQIWRDGHYRYRKTVEQRYPLYQRTKLATHAWETVVDGRTRSAYSNYYQLLPPIISPDNTSVIIAEDTQGRELYTLSLGQIGTQIFTPELENTTGEVVWSKDNQQLYYLQKDPHSGRIRGLYHHTIGTPQQTDRLIYAEPDPRFYLSLSQSSSQRYLLLDIAGQSQSETYVLDLDAPKASLQRVKPRTKGVEYYLDHSNDGFYLRTNLNAPHFALFYTPTLQQPWQPLYHPDDEESLESFTILHDWVIVKVRSNGIGLYRYWQKTMPQQRTEITFPDPNYLAWPQYGENTQDGIIDFTYTAMGTPKTHLRYDLRKKQWLDDTQALAGDYHTDYIEITTRDGVRVPVSLIYKKGLLKQHDTPLLLTAYGAYGFSFEPTYGTAYHSLLDRGFIYAIAHIRGGGELGIKWHQQGKKRHKINSINDTVDVANALAKRFNTTHLYALGESAGALAIAGAINQAPTRFKAVVLQVPFLDVVGALAHAQDGTNAQESEEWGSLSDQTDFKHILSYSPYQNITKQPYPALYLIAALQDKRVPFVDSLKYAAKVRALSTSDAPVLVHIEKDSGHSSGQGRYGRIERNLDAYSFLLKQEQQ
ncbi:prolyl oligopeptidase family serine peptidase [Spirabiliibacterium falconis]|uniref:prolyl oligopeptidase family serine peptidase n=1 Tax=Spirabiliibacterium falconis TaxID=572023 RepID=UPI001AAC81F4|nr:prolyl oligopeptidase family serine peptidase [Spirabiliibacterium falconis]MBE2894246.1 S9 family peptidase [Spirabiliibacterium falconis]